MARALAPVMAERGITGLFARLLPEPQGSVVVDSRFPGTVWHDYQEKEALYNAYLRQVEAQRARGSRVRQGWAGGTGGAPRCCVTGSSGRWCRC